MVQITPSGHQFPPQTGSSKITLPPGKAAATAPIPADVLDQPPPPTARAEAWGTRTGEEIHYARRSSLLGFFKFHRHRVPILDLRIIRQWARMASAC